MVYNIFNITYPTLRCSSSFFLSDFEIQLKIGSYRQPTNRYGAHRKFFDYPFLVKNQNFGHK